MAKLKASSLQEYSKAASEQPNISAEIVTKLNEKKLKAHKKCKTADRESFNANRRAKQAFFNSVNATMKNQEISAKKKFNILKKLMKNQKPPSFLLLLKIMR